jgi:hypothetical protein
VAIAEWVLTGGLLAGISYMCVGSLVSGGRRGHLHVPPQVEVRVAVRAAAWADGRVQPGEDRRTRRLELVWTLELDDAAHAHPRWRLSHSADAS